MLPAKAELCRIYSDELHLQQRPSSDLQNEGGTIQLLYYCLHHGFKPHLRPALHVAVAAAAVGAQDQAGAAAGLGAAQQRVAGKVVAAAGC